MGSAVPSIFSLVGSCTADSPCELHHLTTDRAFDRARELAMRKVIGGEARQLISQFPVRSVLTIYGFCIGGRVG